MDFGTGAGSLSVSAKANKTSGYIEVFADKMYGNEPIATIHVTDKGKFNNYEAPVTNSPTGIHDLYFLFTSDNAVQENIMAVDYWQFKQADEALSITTTSIDTDKSAIYYTPAGVTTKHPVGHGIYIKDGKKVLR